MKTRITQRLVESTDPRPPDDVFLWDTDCLGFGVRVYPSGKKAFLVQYRAPDSGKSRREVLGLYGRLTVEQAREAARELLRPLAARRDPLEVREAALRAEADERERREREARAESFTVRQLCAKYLAEWAQRRKPSTLATYERLIAKCILPVLGDRSVAKIDTQDVLELQSALAHTPTQANRTHALLRHLLNRAEKWKLRPRGSNPCGDVERFPEQKRERYLTTEQFAQLGSAIAELEAEGNLPPTAAGAIRLLILTGCRRSEVTDLEPAHVDLEGGVLNLPDSKTGAKSIVLNTQALEVLRAQPLDGTYVFPTASGDAPISLSNPWNRVRTRAGLPDLRLHDLRHSYASIGAAAGQSLHLIGKQLGHTVAATTHRYAHLHRDPVREAANEIGTVIAAALAAEPPAKRVVH